MALPSTGAISFNNVNQELGRASPYNQQVALNDSNVRTLFQRTTAGSSIAMSDGRGKSNFGNVVTFTYIGYGTSWTVPSGVTTIKVRMWGGGGGTGRAPNGYTVTSGGGGGFMEGTISVTPGQSIYLYVADSGYDNVDDTCDCDGNGYVSRIANNYGTGGMHSIVSRGGWASTSNSLDYMIAGGGGGASSVAGGAGGGTTGGEGGRYAAGSNWTPGGGGVSGDPGAGGQGGSGTISSGALWHNAASIYSRNGGSQQRVGETVYCDNNSAQAGAGGHGGSGLAGGGAGYAENPQCGGLPYGSGGGGGSSGYGRGNGYVNSAGTDWTNVTNSQASGGTAGGNTNADFNSSYGGSQQYGRIVIRY